MAPRAILPTGDHYDRFDRLLAGRDACGRAAPALHAATCFQSSSKHELGTRLQLHSRASSDQSGGGDRPLPQNHTSDSKTLRTGLGSIDSNPLLVESQVKVNI